MSRGDIINHMHARQPRFALAPGYADQSWPTGRQVRKAGTLDPWRNVDAPQVIRGRRYPVSGRKQQRNGKQYVRERIPGANPGGSTQAEE